MALSPGLLIRMRSQVQVLAGPPAIVAGQSAASSEPGALAAGLGRAGAARRSPPTPPLAPPGPPTPASGSATTTHRGRAPSRGRQPRGRCRHLALPPAPVPQRRRRDGLRTPAWPAWSLSGQARPPRPAPNPAARSASDLPPANAASAASPASRPPGPSIEPSTARQPQEPPPVPVVTVARPPPEVEGDGRVRTDGWTLDGWTPDGWTLDGWTADGWTPDPLDDPR
jgi:hypothetical protein